MSLILNIRDDDSTLFNLVLLMIQGVCKETQVLLKVNALTDETKPKIDKEGMSGFLLILKLSSFSIF